MSYKTIESNHGRKLVDVAAPCRSGKHSRCTSMNCSCKCHNAGIVYGIYAPGCSDPDTKEHACNEKKCVCPCHSAKKENK